MQSSALSLYSGSRPRTRGLILALGSLPLMAVKMIALFTTAISTALNVTSTVHISS